MNYNPHGVCEVQRKSGFAKFRISCALSAIAFLLVSATSAQAQRVTVAEDDFEGLTLSPFTVDHSNPFFLDGTDWSKDFPAGFVLDNSGNTYAVPPEPVQDFNGWSILDVASWIGHAGIQAGRNRAIFGGDFRNSVLACDPDEADDGGNFDLGGTDMNSFITRTYDITGRDLDSLMLSFDFDTVTEDTQTSVVDLSFDGGVTFQNILTYDSAIEGNNVVFSTDPAVDTQGEFASGIDFNVPGGSTEMQVRFGVIRAGNDWWFAVDNIRLGDVSGEIAFDDFEDETIVFEPFNDANGGPDEPFNPSDGTDWTNVIPNWTIDNDGFWDPVLRLYTRCEELAFDGWAAVDSESWQLQQGNQERINFFPEPSIFGARNTILVADPDAHDDFDVELPEGDPGLAFQEFNSFISRTYDLSDFDNTTVRIEMDWETRIENPQRALIQVSFDGGQTWVTLLDADGADPAKLAELTDFLTIDSFTPDNPDTPDVDENTQGIVDNNDLLNTDLGPQEWLFGMLGSDLPAQNGSEMILRLGCINSRNNWWFAVDNIVVEAEPQSFRHGDANQDGSINFGDINDFVLALQDKPAYDATHVVPADEILDMDASGGLGFSDIGGFVTELQ